MRCECVLVVCVCEYKMERGGGVATGIIQKLIKQRKRLKFYSEARNFKSAGNELRREKMELNLIEIPKVDLSNKIGGNVLNENRMDVD